MPTYGGHCPLLHLLKHFPADGRHCDNCHVAIKGKAFRDLHCQFDLCVVCFKTMPCED